MDDFPRAQWIPTVLAFMAAGLFGCKSPPPTNPGAIAREPNMLLWGDTHVHTSSTGDGSGAVDPNTAYHFAKGLPVVHPATRARVQIETPLDFLIVADDAEGLEETEWHGLIGVAERHYSPCAFTTFFGWEWASAPGGTSLHRIVFTPAGASQARELVPFGGGDGAHPDDLWNWLEQAGGRVDTDFIAIPHHSAPSGTAMTPEADGAGEPVTAPYAQTQMRWEPVTEVTQIEGDFETQVRAALLRGLAIDQRVGANPYKLGMIGSTGSHTGLSSAEENNFWGAAEGDSPGNLEAQGLVAVWAEENTRESIFAAFKRREVYATTGPRIRLRFFGGWGFSGKAANEASMVPVGYTLGHPMGSDLTRGPDGKAPSFLTYAVKDPKGANLDRIQMVKGWVDSDGETHEQVLDVVWSGDRQRRADGTVAPLEDTVDRATGKVLGDQGAPALHGFWSDPDFDPEQPAFYYVRVLQVRTPRHSLYDAIARQIDPKETGHPATVQERAYSSPIWYTPPALEGDSR